MTFNGIMSGIMTGITVEFDENIVDIIVGLYFILEFNGDLKELLLPTKGLNFI